MKEIPLTRGLVALVDDDDYERVGQYSWSALNNGAAQARIGKIRVQMHRFILDAEPGQVIDHINHNRADNRRCNLRFATISQNCGNRRGWAGNYKGVINLRRYAQYARLGPNARAFRAMCAGELLGHFRTELEAAIAYDIAAEKRWGEFAFLNFPKKKSLETAT
jgi:hypothetical protein